MRVHERGVGETLSCGTGLCATGVTLRALTGISHWTIHVLGGVLDVDVDDESVRLTGSATIVARIELNPQH
jgi:diaminopimelate epimerase